MTPIDAQTSGEHRVPGRTSLRATAPGEREMLLRGRRAFDRGDDTVALETLSDLAERGNLYADVHYMIGILEERRGERKRAIESLHRATRINPSYVEALLALASLHEFEGDFAGSESYAERASQLSRKVSGRLDSTTRGKLSNQQAALADALLEAGEHRDAIEQYRRTLDRCPNFHDIRHRLGIALRDSGLPFQAAQEFRRILGAQPSMLESQIQLGLTYYTLGRTPEAIREWESVLELDPSRDEARMYLRLVHGSASTSASALDPGDRSTAATHANSTEPHPSETGAGWSTRPLDPSSLSPAPAVSPTPAVPAAPAVSPAPADFESASMAPITPSEERLPSDAMGGTDDFASMVLDVLSSQNDELDS